MTNIESKEPKENSKEKKRRYLYKFLPSGNTNNHKGQIIPLENRKYSHKREFKEQD